MKSLLTQLLLIFLISGSILAQTVTTITDGFLEDGMAIDSDGNLYVGHFSGDKVFKVTPSGDVSPFITGLVTPNGLAFDSNDNLFVCDWQANTIYKYDINGNLLDSYNTSGNPSGITKSYDSDDMIFSHYSSNKISILSSDGTISPLSDDPLLNGPVGLTYDENGNLFVGNYNNRNIYKVLSDGSLDHIAQLPGSGSLPNLGFLTYSNGLLYGTIISNHKIYSINPNATNDFAVFAGSTAGNTDGDLSEAKFNQPNGLIFNEAGDVLYVAEFGTKNLRIISNIISPIFEPSVQALALDIAPNPAKHAVQIKANLPVNTKYELKVYAASGQEMIHINGVSVGQNLEKTLDISRWIKGSYVVQVVTPEQIFSGKLVK